MAGPHANNFSVEVPLQSPAVGAPLAMSLLLVVPLAEGRAGHSESTPSPPAARGVVGGAGGPHASGCSGPASSKVLLLQLVAPAVGGASAAGTSRGPPPVAGRAGWGVAALLLVRDAGVKVAPICCLHPAAGVTGVSGPLLLLLLPPPSRDALFPGKPRVSAGRGRILGLRCCSRAGACTRAQMPITVQHANTAACLL